MKYLLLVLVVVGVLWLVRTSRRRALPPKPPAGDVPRHETMLACAHCGVHLPRSDALPGRGGVFCDAAHRAAFERAHPQR